MDDHPQDGTPKADDTTRSPAVDSRAVDGSDLLVPSLRIQNFRGFHDLNITRLGRVNLIVGKNSIGKSTVLEALQLLFDRTNDDRILRLLQDRDQHRRGVFRYGDEFEEHANKISYVVESLFHSRPRFGMKWNDIHITIPQREFSLKFEWIIEEGPLTLRSKQQDTPHIPISSESIGVLCANDSSGYRFFVKFKKSDPIKENQVIRYTSYTVERRANPDSHLAKKNVVFIGTAGKGEHSLPDFWDRIALSDVEQHVTDAVRLVEPRVERIASVSSGRGMERILVVKIKNVNGPFTLKSLGEGALRLFGIALGIGNAENGIFLVDEAENGLHWSVQKKMWDLIFSLATSLNVQVFATTHSYDCIKGFTAAAMKAPAVGTIIRLERHGDDVTARVLDEDTMAYAMEEDIEVR